MSSYHRILILLFLLFPATSIGLTAASADTPMDYMVQQVCDNGVGGHTSEDPVTCPSRARKLRVSEFLPYHKWEGSQVLGSQISDAYPVGDISGRFRVIQTNFFTRRSQVPYFDAANPYTGDTGYDLIGADGSYVAGMGTYDPGRGWQPFYNASNSCNMSDAWILAPKFANIPIARGEGFGSINLSSPQCPSNSNTGKSYTTWDYYNSYIYQSGKSLDTLKVWHFAGPTVDSDAIEIFMYTKQYGKTKWEAWRKASGQYSSPNATAVSRCGIGTNNGYSHYGSTDYTLQDCHDWSYILVPSSDWDPSLWHVDPIYYSVNYLKNTHMQCTTGSSTVASDCGGSSICQTIGPWGRNGNANWAYDQNLQNGTPTANCALRFSIPSAPAGQSIYQDTMSFSRSYSNYTFGAAIWGPNNTGQAQQFNMVLYEINSAGQEVARHTLRDVVSSIPKYFMSSFVLSSATTRLRFEIYPETQDIDFEITDAWIAPKI